MDYSSPINQIYALLHYGFAFIILFLILPRYFLSRVSEDPFENRVALFSIAVCFYIVLIYVLVLSKLYEVISFVSIILVLITQRYWRSKALREQAIKDLNVWFYECFEKGFRVNSRWQAFRSKFVNKNTLHSRIWTNNSLGVLLFTSILGVSAYVRFYDAVLYAAPAMSDGAVTLSWMKYINSRMLFHDGIYPQGFHIILSLLSKFAAIDPLYILKYSGPLCGILTEVGLYFAVSRLTGNKFAGIISMAMYGLGGAFLFGGDWERQSATNSQEFAYIFVFPSFYFFLRYLEKGSRLKLLAGFSALSISGFVHSLVFAYAGMGLGVAIIASLLTPSVRSWKRITMIISAGILSVILTYAPIQIALWAGINYNESAAQFLTSTAEVKIPALTIKDVVGLSSLGIIFIMGIIGWRDKSSRLSEWFVLGMGTASFLLYYAAPAVTKSSVLATRTESLWILSICFCTGFAWWSIWRYVKQFRGRKTVETLVTATSIVVFAIIAHISPIVTYKMDWESVFRQYLRIASIHSPKTWTIVSQEEEYSLVYGQGWHQYIQDLLNKYDPQGTPITRKGQDEYDPDTTRWIYVFEEKQVFKVSNTLSIYHELEENRYTKHEKEQKLLKDWLKKYEQYHGKPPIFYEDEFIRIWLLERPEAADKENRRLWGSSSVLVKPS